MGESLFVLKYISIGAAIALLIWIIGFVLYKWLIAPCFYGGRKEWRRTTVSAYYLSNSDDLRYSQLLVAESFGTGRRTPSPSSSLSRARPLSSLSFSHYEESESSRSNRAFTAELGKPPVLPPWDSAPSYVVPGNWFEFVTGVTEYGFAGSKGNIVVPYYDLAGSDGGDIDPKAEIYQRWRDAPYLGIKNVADGRLYRAGMFYTASVKELNKSVCEIAEKVPHMRKNACKFIVDVLENSENEDLVNLSYLQTLPENENAMFQIASNFNCIESPDASASLGKSNFVTKYANYLGFSQSACSSVSAGPGAVVRAYCPFFSEDKAPIEWGQTNTRQIELLGNLKRFFTVVNGFISQKGTEVLIEDNNAERDSAIGLIKVGVHVGIDVSFGELSHRGLRVVKNPHRISQVLCGVMSLHSTENRSQKDSAVKEQILLEAAYKGAFLAAIKHGSSRLFLTMLGTGRQENEIGDVFNAIWYAYRDFGHGKLNTSLKEIHLVIKTPIPELDQFYSYMRQAHVPIEIKRI